MSATLVEILDAAYRWPTRPVAPDLGYEQMIDQARRVGARLRYQGAGRDVVVGLVLERSPALVVCMIGVWLTGAGFELGVRHPLVVDTEGFPAAIARGASLTGVCSQRPPQDLAYVCGGLRVTHGELPARIAAPHTGDDAWILDVCATLAAGAPL